MGSQKRRKKKNKKKYYYAETPETPRGFEEILDMPDHKFLRKLPSYAGFVEDNGKELYSYSDSRTRFDFSPEQQERIKVSPQGIFLIVLSCFLAVWFFESLIYRLIAEADKVKVILSMIPSFIIVSAFIAIFLLSYFGAWGDFLRWAFRNNLVHGRDAASRQMHREMKADMDRADYHKYIECAVRLTENYFWLTVYGQKYVFNREGVFVKIGCKGDGLKLIFTIDGRDFEFPGPVPKTHLVSIKKAFFNKFEIIKGEEPSKFDAKKLIREIPFIIVALGIVAVSILAIVAHYLWIPELPPFIGIFFLLMSGLVFCNIFSDIPAVSELGIPFAFSIVLLIFPPMAYVWIETDLMKNQLTFVHIITHCTPFAAGFGCFWILGFYCLSYAISKAVDYVRFGKN